MKRLVLDTNVVVSAMLWDGSPARLLASDAPNELQLFTSIPLLYELAETLSRPKFSNKVAQARRTVDQLIYRYSALAIPVVPVPTVRLAPDPDDDVVIGTAINAKADFLVTGDRTLLSVLAFGGGRIVSVQEALKVCLAHP